MARPSRRASGKQQGGERKGHATAGSSASVPDTAKRYSLATFVAPPAFATPAPNETKEFRKAADGNPRLRDEHRRLLAEYSEDELVALAGTLFETFGRACTVRRRRGARPLAVPDRADREAQIWGARIADRAEHAKLPRRASELRAMMTEAIEHVAPLLPKGAGESARRERAERLVDAYVKKPPSTTRLAPEVARKLAEILSKRDGTEK